MIDGMGDMPSSFEGRRAISFPLNPPITIERSINIHPPSSLRLFMHLCSLFRKDSEKKNQKKNLDLWVGASLVKGMILMSKRG